MSNINCIVLLVIIVAFLVVSLMSLSIGMRADIMKDRHDERSVKENEASMILAYVAFGLAMTLIVYISTVICIGANLF